MAVAAPPETSSGGVSITRWILAFGIVLAALGVVIGTNATTATVRPTDEALLRNTLATADKVGEHGQAMMSFGNRRIAYAGTPDGQREDARSITIHGAHWVTDGQTMVRLAGEIRQGLTTRPPYPTGGQYLELSRMHG